MSSMFRSPFPGGGAQAAQPVQQRNPTQDRLAVAAAPSFLRPTSLLRSAATSSQTTLASLGAATPVVGASNAEWCVVGAGPSAIVAVAELLERGVAPSAVVWVDDKFRVGRMENYVNVPGNNKAKQVLGFLQAFTLFRQCLAEARAGKEGLTTRSAVTSPKRVSSLLIAEGQLRKLDQEREHQLGYTRALLQALTECLCEKVRCIYDRVSSLQAIGGVSTAGWNVTLSTTGKSFYSRNVLLATGSSPLTVEQLLGPQWSVPPVVSSSSSQPLPRVPLIKEIPYDVALDRIKLEQALSSSGGVPDDSHGVVVVVFGGAQSAILVVKYLYESAKRAKKIINLYNTPLVFAQDMGSWIKNDAKGVKGETARWYRENQHTADFASRIVRMQNTDSNRALAMSEATHVVCAAGFRRNKLPTVLYNTTTSTATGQQTTNLGRDISDSLRYDDKTGQVRLQGQALNSNSSGSSAASTANTNAAVGQVVPNLFGVGIAFPELYTDPLGHSEHRIGIPGFIHHVKRVVPLWIALGSSR